MELYTSSEITVHKLNELREEDKKNLLSIYPSNYIGYASQLAKTELKKD